MPFVPKCAKRRLGGALANALPDSEQNAQSEKVRKRCGCLRAIHAPRTPAVWDDRGAHDAREPHVQPLRVSMDDAEELPCHEPSVRVPRTPAGVQKVHWSTSATARVSRLDLARAQTSGSECSTGRFKRLRRQQE